MAKEKKAETDNISPGNVFQEVASYEETEAKTRLAKEDAKLFYETCDEIRNLFATIAAIKNSKDANAKQNITKKRIKATLLIAELKKLNRLEKIRMKIGRDALHKEKQRLDSTHLLLQNLLYETDYLDREVTKCLQFKSKDEEIDLVPVEEFYKDAPEDIKKPDITSKDEHQLRLARLQWELKQRKNLSEYCLELQEVGRRVSTSLNETKDKLNNLAPQLRDLLAAAEPLQKSLGLPSSGLSHLSNSKINLLPAPLFLLHAQTTAYAEAFSNDLIHVCIDGDEDEASRINENKISEFYDSDSDVDDDRKEEENHEKSKRHHRASAKISKQERAEQKINSVLKAHPLCVQLTIKLSEISLILNFYYLLQLKIIVVKSSTSFVKSVGVCSADVLNSHNILSGLFDNDHGDDSPHPATNYILRSVGLKSSFSNFVSQLGHPYHWAQRMCGLDFSSISNKTELSMYNKSLGINKPSSEMSNSSVESVLIALKKRIKSRISLMKELQDLESGNIAPFENFDNLPFSLNSTLTVWQSISWAEYSQSASVKALLNLGVVSQNDLLYRAIITRQSAKLMALVALKHDYPMHAPIFSLTLHWNGTYHAGTNDNIRDIERCINTDWCIDKNSDAKTNISLSGQLTKLLCFMDILLETSGSSEFPADKVMFQSVRGRNRIKPYKFIKDCSGIFTQY